MLGDSAWNRVTKHLPHFSVQLVVIVCMCVPCSRLKPSSAQADGEMSSSEAEYDDSDRDSTWSLGRHAGMVRPARDETEGDAGALAAVNFYGSTKSTAMPSSSATSIAAPPPKPKVDNRFVYLCLFQLNFVERSDA